MKTIKITFFEVSNTDYTSIKIDYDGKSFRNYEVTENGDPEWENQSIQKECTEEQAKFLIETLIYQK